MKRVAEVGMRVGIFAPSSVVPRIEFEMGVDRIRDAGLEVRVHPQCFKKHLFWAGADEARARALLDMAVDPKIDVLWSARGGYGAARLLPMLERETRRIKRLPPKLLVGYSDSTALMDFVVSEWKWSTLHAPMPGLKEFARISDAGLVRILEAVQGLAVPRWKSLKFLTGNSFSEICAPLVGGNLSVWASLVGTPYQPRANGKILFLEEIGESHYRIDRMTQQLLQAGAFEGVRAIILGTFSDCEDAVPSVLASRKGDRMVPLRPRLTLRKALGEIFGEVGDRLGIPVACGLPVGHGGGYSPLPLGASYAFRSDGTLEVIGWRWLS